MNVASVMLYFLILKIHSEGENLHFFLVFMSTLSTHNTPPKYITVSDSSNTAYTVFVSSFTIFMV